MASESERVGTVERERVAALLADAASAGYLDTDEFAERSASAFAARTGGDLSVLTADLPMRGCEPGRRRGVASATRRRPDLAFACTSRCTSSRPC